MSLQYFNSIKVRLELMNPTIGAAALTAFQFHKGAIRTTEQPIKEPIINISIP